jgi:hypothetical protein
VTRRGIITFTLQVLRAVRIQLATACEVLVAVRCV